jgi:hypothetical protein
MRKEDWVDLAKKGIYIVISVVISFISTFSNHALREWVGKNKLIDLAIPVLVGFGILLVFLLFSSLFVAYKLGSSTFINYEVREPEDVKFKLWEKLLFRPLFWSQNRQNIASTLIVSTIILIVGFNNSIFFETGILVFFVLVVGIIRFYSASGDVKDTLHQSIKQMMFTLGNQIELRISEALDNKNFRVRIRLTIFNPEEKNLSIKYQYHMEKDRDLYMKVGINQGVIGRVFKDAMPWMLNPYDPKQLRFDSEQLKLMPSNIKWKMGFPILCDHNCFGVLAIDCDKELNMQVLDDIKSFAHPMTSAISIMLFQYPTKEVQMALNSCNDL